jgi:hypothetical protein
MELQNSKLLMEGCSTWGAEDAEKDEAGAVGERGVVLKGEPRELGLGLFPKKRVSDDDDDDDDDDVFFVVTFLLGLATRRMNAELTSLKVKGVV